MYRLFRPLLFSLPAESAHDLALGSLELLSAAPRFCSRLREQTAPRTDLSVSIGSLTFPNPIGLAAGLDKNGVGIPGLFALGFGAVEVGTVTPRPQPGNPKPRLFRHPEQTALVNRMGFNNAGMHAMAARLRELAYHPAPVGVNIGKNKDTPLEHASDDYVQAAELLGPLADYVVVNASSPNTPGLRQLQEPEALRSLLTAVRSHLPRGKPLFLKVSPDLSFKALDEAVKVARACGVDALIATNTTIAREGAQGSWETGGLSGKPLRNLSTTLVRSAFRSSGGALPVIGVGGVFNAEDAYEKIRAGASLVQIYSGFIYLGPGMVLKLLRGLESLLHRDGFKSVQEAIGTAA